MNNRQLQLYKKQKAMYQSLTEEQLKIVNEYFDNNMKKLKKICDPLIFHKKVPETYHEDLYGVASDVLIESLIGFDPNKKCSFKTFFTGNIKRAFYDWTRDNTRLCRCNIQTDAEGKIVRDEEGNVVIIPNIPLDAPTKDGTDIKEKVASDFNIENNLSEEIGFSLENNIQNYSPAMQEYLQNLSRVQLKVLELMNQGYNQEEIQDILHITKELYKDSITAITSKKATRKIKKSLRGYKNVR